MLLSDINPEAARRLSELRTALAQSDLDRALAARALAETRARHARETERARRRHSRRPTVTLV